MSSTTQRKTSKADRLHTIGAVCQRLKEEFPDISISKIRQLEEFGLIWGRGNGDEKRYPEIEADVASVCAQLAKYGIDARHLRLFRTSAENEVALLERLVAPALPPP